MAAGLYVRRDLEGGQMSRDVTVFVDDDDKAYHIFASEDNLTLQDANTSVAVQFYKGMYGVKICENSKTTDCKISK